ncbi:hypothetical protein HJB88_17145 [Rhizobium sp. NZLR5]|uniref:hypothetical protein n=1 Tax=Rhizobium sp. NZLR5 TaxID=2731103 RepID=UPI001C8409CA|nr:hypothetical protein [Rhizobium sp. NZLR5]MBX5184355.1 hypothetical protein [Rhizobium sp. NZLR5]
MPSDEAAPIRRTIRMFPAEKTAFTEMAFTKIVATEKGGQDEKSALLKALRISRLQVIHLSDNEQGQDPSKFPH